MRKAPLTVLAGLGLLGCAATGPDFIMAPPAADVATVYIYRPAKEGTLKGSPDVFVGDEKLFALQNGSYNVLVLPPGAHQIVVKTGACFPAVTQGVAARGGEQTFLRFSMPTPTRPPPVESSGHWSIDLFRLPTRVAEAQEWSDEQCKLARPRFEAVDKANAADEITKTKLVDGGSAEGLMPKSLAPGGRR